MEVIKPMARVELGAYEKTSLSPVRRWCLSQRQQYRCEKGWNLVHHMGLVIYRSSGCGRQNPEKVAPRFVHATEEGVPEFPA